MLTSSDRTRLHSRGADPMPAHDSLIDRLTGELIACWKRGEHTLADEFLERHPELWADPEAAVELVYEEICLRQEQGEENAAASVLQRFPQWRTRLELMLECHQLLEVPEPRFPVPGEIIAGYRLLEALGSGGSGEVFLAQQSELADRPVVLKITSLLGNEHLNLARLQHTHIVPLYAVHHHAERNLRILCMPYLGGITLEHLLRTRAERTTASSSGERLLTTLQAAGVEPRGVPELMLGRLSCVQSLCWIAACLAEALHHAHECNLVHLDVKPANILLAADGQPMLLDFHLAREPLLRGALPDGIGGTPPYMAPEQNAASAALIQAQPFPQAVDRHADVFALGAVLYEALGGQLPLSPSELPPPLCRINPQVSPGLSDIVARCLAWRPEDRYRTAAALAEDLRRHLADHPLREAGNRSLVERISKWRRRRPAALQVLVSFVLLAGAVMALGCGGWSYYAHLSEEVKSALQEGHRSWSDHRHFDAAIDKLNRGLNLARTLPFQDRLIADLQQEIRLARKAQGEEQRRHMLRHLHVLAEQTRGVVDFELQPVAKLRALDRHCREFWTRRQEFREWLQSSDPEAANDLLEIVLFGTHLRVHLADREHQNSTRREVLEILAEAEFLFGPSAVLDDERGKLNLPPGAVRRPPQTMWEHLALGRSALLADDIASATPHLQEALAFQPHGFWPNFYHGQCAHRLGEHDNAVAAFSVCIGATPDLAAPYINRALALAALGKSSLALRDYRQAIRLDPTAKNADLDRRFRHP